EPPTRVSWEENPVIRWLMTEGLRIADAKSFLESFASRLRTAGVDVSRITTGVPVLHPQLFSTSSLWEHDKGVAERRYHADTSQDAILANSPIRAAYDGRPFRSEASRDPGISHSRRAASPRHDRLRGLARALQRRNQQGALARDDQSRRILRRR